MENEELEKEFNIGDWVIPNNRTDFLDHMVYRIDSIDEDPKYTFYYLTNYYLSDNKIIFRKIPYLKQEIYNDFSVVEKPNWFEGKEMKDFDN